MWTPSSGDADRGNFPPNGWIRWLKSHRKSHQNGWFRDDLWMEILENLKIPLEKRKKWPSSRPWLLVAFLWRGDLLMGGSGWQTEEGGRLTFGMRKRADYSMNSMNSMNIDSRSWQIGRRWVFTKIGIWLYHFISLLIYFQNVYLDSGSMWFLGRCFGSPNTIIEGYRLQKKHPQIQSQKVFGAGGMCDPLGDFSYCRL